MTQDTHKRNNEQFASFVSLLERVAGPVCPSRTAGLGFTLLSMRRRSGRKCIEMAKWFESARGGTESAREGTESAREGTESARDGTESAREGTESAREGTESAREGTESALVSLRL